MQLYRSLVGTDRHAGNIAFTMNEARRAMFAAYDASAESFSPVLYLRGMDGCIFDFQHRTLHASAVATASSAHDAVTANHSEIQHEAPIIVDKSKSYDRVVVRPASTHDVSVGVATPELHPNADKPSSKKTLLFGSIATLLAILAVGFFTFGNGSTTLEIEAIPNPQASQAPTSTPPSTVVIVPSLNPPAPEPLRNAKNGTPCASSQMCRSKICVDGVCCDNACAGSCRACTAVGKGTGSDGSCGPVAAGLDPTRECGKGERCNGNGACSTAFVTTKAGSARATGGTLKSQ
jgi:hypothetical protein